MKGIESSNTTEPQTTSHPASAIKLKTSPTKRQSSESGTKVTSALPKSSQISADKRGKKAASAKKSQQSGEGRSKPVKNDGEGDQFSAALDALNRLSFNDMPDLVSKSTPVSAKLVSKSERKNLSGQESTSEGPIKMSSSPTKEKIIAKEKRKKSAEEFSPSVSAMFEAVKSGSQAGEVQPTAVNQPDSPREANTATLKSMLNIESPADQKAYSKGRGKSPTSSPLKATPMTPPRTSVPIHTPPRYHTEPVSSSPQNAPLLSHYSYGLQHGQYPPPDLPETVRKLYRPPRGMVAQPITRPRIPQQPPLIQDFPRPPRPPVWRGTYM